MSSHPHLILCSLIALAFPLCAAESDPPTWQLKSSTVVSAPHAPVTHIRKTLSSGRNATIDLILFDTRQCTLLVVDHPGLNHGDLAGAMLANHCLAGVNGGYFRPDRLPLGLVISNGNRLHPLETARILTGILCATRDKISLLRLAQYQPGPSIRQAVECGPFLIDAGKAVAGLDSSRSAVRTAALSDGKTTCAFIAGGPFSLLELSKILADPAIITEMKVDRALNLDGGASTGMWVDATPQPFYLPEISSVRTYIGIIAKPSLSPR